jgi:hypothetical protein
MPRTAWTLSLTCAVVLLPLLGASKAAAQVPCYAPAPVLSYYSPPPVYGAAPAPVVSYYAPPVTYSVPAVSYYAPAAVSYYAPAPVVSYYAPAPVVSYYAPAPASAVTTTRYGFFGRPRVSTTYYAPVYVR